MILGGLEEEAGGEDAAGQGGIAEERGDSTEEEELPSSEGKKKAIREWLELQEEQDQKWLEEQREAAAQGLRRSSRQKGSATEERSCSGGVNVECQAWKETTLIARGEMVVPRLRSRQRAT